MVSITSKYPGKPPQDSCLLQTLATIIVMVIIWLGVGQ